MISIAEALADPDEVGTSAYRAIHELLTELEDIDDDENEPVDLAIAECDEIISWAQEAQRVLKIARRDYLKKNPASTPPC